MADVFSQSDAVDLLRNKYIILLGDSNMRAIYKDLVTLLNRNSLVKESHLRTKQEKSFCGDELGKHSELNRGRDYQEERSFQKGDTRIDFIFITRCYNADLEDMIEDINLGLRKAPDVIYINSTLWDVNRWGPNGVVEFKDNLRKLAKLFKDSLPTSTLVIWATALPVSYSVESSLLIKQLKFLGQSLRFDVMEANHFARQEMVYHGFDVIDNHYYMRMQIHRRSPDGIHYSPVAIRLLTNLLLTHIALSWDVPLPNRVSTILLEKAKGSFKPVASPVTPQLKLPQFLSREAKKLSRPRVFNIPGYQFRPVNGQGRGRYAGGRGGQFQHSWLGRVHRVDSLQSSLSWDVPRPNRVSTILAKANSKPVEVSSTSPQQKSPPLVLHREALKNANSVDSKKKNKKKRKRLNKSKAPALPSGQSETLSRPSRVKDIGSTNIRGSALSWEVALANRALEKAKGSSKPEASSAAPQLMSPEVSSTNTLKNNTTVRKKKKRKAKNSKKPGIPTAQPTAQFQQSKTFKPPGRVKCVGHAYNRGSGLDSQRDRQTPLNNYPRPQANWPDRFQQDGQWLNNRLSFVAKYLHLSDLADAVIRRQQILSSMYGQSRYLPY